MATIQQGPVISKSTVRQPPAVSRSILWTSWILSAIPVLMMLFASSAKLLQRPEIIETMGKFGFSPSLVLVIGAIELFCTIVYVIPQTSVLGAILYTGLFGGAIVTNVRIGNPGYTLPLLFGILAWGGLYLRDPRLRDLIPIRR
jgi:hypothetical protein